MQTAHSVRRGIQQAVAASTLIVIYHSLAPYLQEETKTRFPLIHLKIYKIAFPKETPLINNNN